MKKDKLAAAAPLLALTASFGWGTSGVFNRVLTGFGFSAYQNSLARSLTGLIILAPILFLFFPEKMRLKSWKHLGFFVISGALGLAMTNTAYFMTMQISTMAMAAVMVYIGPALVILVSTFLFREKMSFRKILSLGFALTGCIIMSGILSGGAGALSPKGLAIGLLSGVGYMFYNVGSRLAVPHYDSITISAYTLMFYVIGMIPFVASDSALPMIQAHPVTLVAMLALGLISSVMPYTLFPLALNHMELGKATILGFGEPLTATLWGLFLFGEALTPKTVISLGLILLSILVVNIGVKEDLQSEEEAGEFDDLPAAAVPAIAEAMETEAPEEDNPEAFSTLAEGALSPGGPAAPTRPALRSLLVFTAAAIIIGLIAFL